MLQALVNFLCRSLPAKDVTTFEYIRAYNSLCVATSTNYLVYSKALMQRANNEVDRSKTFERSLAQSQQLID